MAQAQVPGARLPSRWCHGDEMAVGSELQNRLGIGLTDPLKLLRRQPQIPGQQQRRWLQLGLLGGYD